MDKKVKKKIKEHAASNKYVLTPEQEDDILQVYLLNNQHYDESKLVKSIETFVSNICPTHFTVWREKRRPSVYATRVDVANSVVPSFEKSDETFNFLMSRFGTKIPFCLITSEQKKTLVESMYPIILEKGVSLIVEGDFGAEMYVVEEGRFDVLVKGKLTNGLEPGTVFGELSLLHGIPRTATVIASERSKVWAAEQTSFSCIRIRAHLYQKGLMRDTIVGDASLKGLFGTAEEIENVIEKASCRFISAGTSIDLKDNEVVIVLSNGKIIDEKERDVKPKDLIKEGFYADTDVECAILSLGNKVL